jgi:hypothetical protein
MSLEREYLLTSVQSVRTEEARADFQKLVVRNNFRLTHILNLLGLRSRVGGRSILADHEDARTFDETMTNGAHEHLLERVDSGTVARLWTETAIMQPAKDISEDYGRILWGKESGDHMFRPGEIVEYPRLLCWEDDTDRSV